MKRHSSFVIGLLAMIMFTTCGGQTTSSAAMAEANRLYEAGQFAGAAVGYQALVDAGAHDGRLYYNLGDAYFKRGDLGRAILNFCRAQRLLPRDGDVAANLRLARAKTLDRIETEDTGIVGFIRRAVGWSALDEAAIATLALWVALCGLVSAAIVWPARRRLWLYLTVVVAVLLFLGVLTVGVKWMDEHGPSSGRPAVVVAEEVAVHSGPGDDYLAEFTLHAGAEVRVVERRAGWVRIALPGDLQGWTPGEAVIEILPAR